MRAASCSSERQAGKSSGRIETDVYVVDADGSESDVELLFADGGAGRWSPDGSEVSVFCCDDGMVAHIVDVVTGDVRGVETPDPTLELYCDFGWSPDGERLVCEGYGVDDPSRNGIYSVRASDGGDLTRITSNPDGGDIPGDYSPDGTHLVFKRFEDDVPTGMFVVDIADDGAGEGEPQQLTPEGMVLDDTGHAGRWSPDGEEILFVARESEDHHKAIWVVDVGADGGAPSQLPIAPGCGGPLGEADAYGCYSPDWSPDGEQDRLHTLGAGRLEREHLDRQRRRKRPRPSHRRHRRQPGLGNATDDNVSLGRRGNPKSTRTCDGFRRSNRSAEPGAHDVCLSLRRPAAARPSDSNRSRPARVASLRQVDRVALPRLDAVGCLLEQVMGEVAERSGRGDLLADGGHVGILGIAPGPTPALQRLGASGQAGIGPRLVLVLAEHDLDRPRQWVHW